MPKELLVVDDEPKVCGALKAFFSERGFHVATAASVQAALDQLRHVQADVVLLDLKLPDGNGLALLTKLKAQLPGLRVVVISGLSDQATMSEAFQRGASDFLTKPFDFDHAFFAAMGVEAVDLRTVTVEPEAVEKVPMAMARQYRVLPIRMRHKALEMAMADPLDERQVEELKALLGCELKPLGIIGGDLTEAIQQYYRLGPVQPEPAKPSASVSAPTPVLTVPLPAQPPATAPQPAQAPAGAEDASGVVRLVHDLIRHAHANRATDLHLGVGAEGPWVRERIDGILCEVPVPLQFRTRYPGIVSHLKMMAKLETAEHQLPQDGRVWFELSAQENVDLRVSVLPTVRGESLAVRLLESSQIIPLEQLGMQPEQRLSLESLLAKPAGLLLVTGPTGSGKSASLYAFLSRLNTGRVNILTMEDPIEHELSGVTQIQAQPAVGLTFATGVRAILRHDPDVIMVGEIRDQETAHLAVRAALSGHLVLSTLHTNDASSGITRLTDLGIEPFLLCSTLLGILSQRLPRMLCPDCRAVTEVEASSLTAVGPSVPAYAGLVRLGKAQGCRKCRNTGYLGRIGVFELLVVDHHIRSLMIKQTPSIQIRQSAVSRGMMTLWHSGWQQAQAGATSLQELIRVLPPEPR